MVCGTRVGNAHIIVDISMLVLFAGHLHPQLFCNHIMSDSRVMPLLKLRQKQPVRSCMYIVRASPPSPLVYIINHPFDPNFHHVMNPDRRVYLLKKSFIVFVIADTHIVKMAVAVFRLLAQSITKSFRVEGFNSEYPIAL